MSCSDAVPHQPVSAAPISWTDAGTAFRSFGGECQELSGRLPEYELIDGQQAAPHHPAARIRLSSNDDEGKEPHGGNESRAGR